MNTYLEEIKKIVLQHLGDEYVAIGLFGSRARAQERNGSDVDIVVITSEDFDHRKITLLREKLEAMNTPYKVDIVELSDKQSKFAQAIDNDIQWWKRQEETRVISK